MELFECEYGLVDNEEWIKRIDHIKPQFGNLQEIFVKSVESRKPNSAILLSGGIDSTLIAHISKNPCYSIGIEGCADIDEALKAAKIHGLSLKTRIFSLDEIEEFLKQLAPLFDIDEFKDENLAVLFGVGAVVLGACKFAMEDGFNRLMTGLGSEEIFAGYNRHAKSADVNVECWNGLKLMYGRDLIRDSIIAKHLGVSFVTPFLDMDVISCAMAIPGEEKIGVLSKMPIRKVALELGLDVSFAMRPKKAAQYGSGIDKAIKLLAKRAGYDKKGEYLESLKQK